jgi:hypothetical protein
MSPDFKDRWFKMSLLEQMGNLGSEVGRASKWQDKDEKSFWSAVERALDLFDLIREDKRWENRLYEINRARESFVDAVLGGEEYQSNLQDLEKYFMQFALASVSKR